MNNFTLLGSKEVKHLKKRIMTHWNIKEWVWDLAFFQNSKGKIFIINKSLGSIDWKQLRIDSVGLYFCDVGDGDLRLSVEGSQLLGPFANSNILNIRDDEIDCWARGESLVRKEGDSFVIVKHNDDFLGCGKIKPPFVLNYFPKSRRLPNEE